MTTDIELVRARIVSHEELCAERYENIDIKIKDLKTDLSEKTNDIKKLFSWSAITVFGMLAGTLGWSLQKQYDANLSAQQATAAQIGLLKAQLQNAQAIKPAPPPATDKP